MSVSPNHGCVTTPTVGHKIHFYTADILSCINSMSLNERNGVKRLAVLRRRFDDKKGKVSPSSLVEIWDMTGNPFIIQTIYEDDHSPLVVQNICWGKNGRLIASTMTGHCLEYDLERNQIRNKVDVPGGAIWSMAVNLSKDFIVLGSEDGTMTLFKLGRKIRDKFEVKRVIGKGQSRILSLAWFKSQTNDPNDDKVIAGSDGVITIWKLEKNICLQTLKVAEDVKVWCLTLTPDAKTIVAGDSRGCTSFWDITTATLIQEFHSHQSDILTVVATENGTAFSSGIDPILGQFRIESDNVFSLPSLKSNHTHDVRTIVVDPNGHIYSGGVDTQLVETVLSPKTVYKYPQHFETNFAVRGNYILLKSLKKIELRELVTGPDSTSEPVIRARINVNHEVIAADFFQPLILYSTYTGVKALKIESDSIVKMKQNFESLSEVIHRVVFQSTERVFLTSGCNMYILSMDLRNNCMELTLAMSFSHQIIFLLTSPKYVLVILSNRELFVFDDDDWEHESSFEFDSTPTAASLSLYEEDILWLALADKNLVRFDLINSSIQACEPMYDRDKPKQVMRSITTTRSSVLIFNSCYYYSFDLETLAFRVKGPRFENLLFAASILGCQENTPELALVELTYDVRRFFMPPPLKKKRFGKT